MPVKNRILGLLVVVNLVLLSAVLVGALRGQPAYAQRQGLATSNYVAITAEIQSGYDAMYILDLTERRLNVLVPRLGGSPTLELVASRDLKRDFRDKPQP